MLRKSTKSLRKKRTNMIVSLLIILSMISSVVLPAAASPYLNELSAVPQDLERLDPYGAEDGNIALSAKVEAAYANGSSVAANANNGKLASGSTGSVWNTWGTQYGNPDNPVWIQYTWNQPQVLESMRVMWWIYTDGGVRWARDCNLQYLVNDEWVDYGSVGTDGNSAAFTGEGGAEANKPWPSPKRWGANTKWNVVNLDSPIITKGVRLSIKAERNSGTAPGIGISEWEVFGYVDPAVADLAEIQEDFLMELLSDVELPSVGSNGSTITWSESTDPALGNDGKVTRPANGEPDATGQITATAENGDFIATKQFEFSVFADMDDEKIATTDLEAIDIGSVTDRTTNFTFPQEGRFGSVFTWNTENSKYLWTDGNVLRPPSGEADAKVKLTATATFGSASVTRDWEVTIPAYPGAGRSIVSCEPIIIECPVGDAPKLPNFVKVLYSNGESEQRRVSWEGYTTAAQTAQAEYPVGHTYTMNGNVLGDNAITNGYQVTAEITVVDGEAIVPSNNPLVQTLPLNEVTLEDDPDGEANRLTLNRDNQIEYILGVDVTRMLYNYRETFGLSTEGYAAPGGWDSRTTKLKGHGYGHYLSGLAFAYASGATDDEKSQLMSRMKRMTDEMREMQEMTFVKLPTEDRFREARDRYSTDSEVKAMTNVRLMDDATAPRDPSLFGYGYINAIQPEHLILIENYAPYDGNMENYGVWAPYYSLHKQLAGLVDIYYALDGGSTEEQAVADKALAIAKDMGMWVWNRLHYCTKAGTRPDANSPGYRDSMWALYIAGEFGGVNETLARLSDIMKAQGNEDDSAKLLEASMCFDNNGASSDTGNIPFFSSLADNRDSIRTLHCNQHIPQIIGALWNFKGSNDAKYYNIAENFWDYIIGRYSFTIGGVGGNNSNEEKFAGTYNQIGVVNTNNSDKICETCAAYNMLKLTKDLNTYNPDDAKYMDYYERLLYNQIIGSIVPGSKSNQVSYGYSIYPNSTRKRSTGNATNPGNTCCSGTGTENHVKYQEAAYFTSADEQTFYVGLYMPTTARWEEQDVTIQQSCVFPSEQSTFMVTPGAETKEFEMKFRVPYWATKDFDIKLNGTSLAESYEPSSYVSTGVRSWSSTDEIVVTMPFGFNVDYLPGKCDSEWYGSLMNGPLVMASTDVASLSRIELDSYLTTGEGTNVTINAPETMTGGTSGEVPTRNVPSLSVNVVPGTTGGDAAPKTFVPHYFAGVPAYTTYFYIPASEENAGVDKTPLFQKITDVTDRISSGMYTDESIAAINEVLTAAAAVYQSVDTTADQLESTIASLEEAIDNLEAVAVDISKLQEKLTEAGSLAEADYTPESFGVLSSKISDARAYKDGSVYTDKETADHIFAIDNAMKSLVMLERAALEEALNTANEKVNPVNTSDKLWDEHEYTEYTRKSWNNFKAIEADSRKVNDNDPKVPAQSEIDNAAEALNRAMDALLPFNLCDEREPLETAIEEAKAYKNDPKIYTDESFAALQNAIVIAEERVEYASLTFPERDGVINDLKKAIEGLNNEVTDVVEEAKQAAIKAAKEAQESADAAKEDAIKAKTDAEAAAASADTATTEAAKAADEAVKAKTEADKAKTEADRAKTEADKALAEAGKSETARLAAEAAQKKAEDAQVKAAAAQTNVEAAQKKAEEAKEKAVAAQSAAETAKNEAKTAQGAAETAAKAAETAKKAAESAKDDAVAAKVAAEAARDTAVKAKNDAAAAKTAAESAKAVAEAAKAEAIAAKTAAESAKAEAIAAKTAAESARADALAAKAAAEAAAKAAAESAQEAKKAKEEAEKAAADAAQKKKDAEEARLAAEKAQRAAESAMKAAQAAQAAADKAIADARNNAKKDSNALTLVGRRAKIKSAKSTKGRIKVTLTKDKAAAGYQIQYSLKKTFKGKPATKTTKNTSYTIKGLKKKTYYVRARGYTTNSMGKKVYSKWSTVKTVKVK
ncbi:beta-L-arabinofuranosidase domain-containing protein [Robinsoniella sp. KNHs210]|uniref:beta-L-arabinofuranosidase domain-containing protein n=1 Tax=Robinsoniella sp. KNHs210 TaxID=1469950 RepID=UPI0006936E01|nr:beta-L-arabinofuranosidase domain-containing protein [Robinsoniella sp. KNHs210]